MSRFDLIFIVRDEHNDLLDRTIALHVLNVHKNTRVADIGSNEIDIQKMRGYIGYCRAFVFLFCVDFIGNARLACLQLLLRSCAVTLFK